MRNLTIKRNKSFVGCLGTMKIYIEDPATEELTVNGTPCRKIGELKNGEGKTFQIDEQALKVFVIADKLSKDYCNEYYQLPEGLEDVYLSGQNRFNPAAGNAFRFDNNESEEVLKNRKHGFRKGLIILMIAVIAGVAVGFFGGNLFVSKNKEYKEKVFSIDGMNITLSEEFRQGKIELYTAFSSKDIVIWVMKEPSSLFEDFEGMTPDQYADFIIQENGLDPFSKNTADGLIWLEYDGTDPNTNSTFHYFAYVYKSSDAFWLLHFAPINKGNAEKYSPKIAEWAKSVTFSD